MRLSIPFFRRSRGGVYAWLIEIEPCPPGFVPLYIALDYPTTDDPNEAAKFNTRAEAEAFIRDHELPPAWHPVEHGWFA